MGGESPPSTSMIDYGEEATHTVGAFIDLNPEVRAQVEREFAIDFTPWKVDVLQESHHGKVFKVPVFNPGELLKKPEGASVIGDVEHYTLEFREFSFYNAKTEETNMQMDHCYVDGRTKVRCTLADLHNMQTWEQDYPLYALRNGLVQEIGVMFKINVFSTISMEAIVEGPLIYKWRGSLVNLYDYSIERLKQVREQITDKTAKGWLQRLAQERYPDIPYL